MKSFPQRRVVSLSLSIYFATFSCLTAVSTSYGSQEKQKHKANAKLQNRHFTPEEAAVLIKKNHILLLNQTQVKNYKNEAQSIGPQAKLYPDAVTKPSSTVDNIISSRYIGPAATNNTQLNNILLDPFGGSPIGNIGSSLPPSSSTPQLPPMPTTFPTGGGLGLPNSNGFSITAAPVSSDYACNFFDNNPFSSILSSIENMKNSITSGVTDGCLNKDMGNMLASNTDALKNSIDFIKYYNSNPEQLSNPEQPSNLNISLLNSHIQSSVNSLNQIATSISNSALLKPECGRYTSSFNKVVTSLNQVISGLAPIALIATAMTPQISGTVKSALLATTVISQISSSTWQSFFSNSIDMSNSIHRKAVLQDVCQYLKIKEKVDYLSNDTAGKIKSLNESLQKKVEDFKGRYQLTEDSNKKDSNQTSNQILIPLLKYRFNIEKQLAEVETGLAHDRLNYKMYDAEIQKYAAIMNKVDPTKKNQDAKDVGNALNAAKFICRRGADFVNRGTIPEGFALNSFGNLFGSFGGNANLPAFPLSILSNLDRVTEILQQSTSNGLPFGGGLGGLPIIPQDPFPTLPTPPAPPPVPLLADSNNESAANDIFQPPPGSIIPPVENQIDPVSNAADDLFNDFKTQRGTVAAAIKLVGENDLRAVKPCADSTIAWMTTMSALMDFTANLANQSRPALLNQLDQNPQYQAWAAEYAKLTSETKAVTPMIKVLNMMLSDRPTLLITEAQNSLRELKNSLFEKPLILGNSAVGGWLYYHLQQHDNSISVMIKNISDLQNEVSAKLTYKHLSKSKDPNKARKDVENFRSLSTITLSTIEKDSPLHTSVCKKLTTGLNRYQEAKNALDSSDFMCSMLNASSTETSSHVESICSGANIMNQISEIDKRRKFLDRSRRDLNNVSINKYVDVMKSKKDELECNIRSPL